MKKTIGFLLFLLLLTGSISCKQSSSLTESEKLSIVHDVQATLQNYHSDIRKSGLTAEFTYLDSSADFFWVPPGYDHFLSYDSVAKILTQNAPMFRAVDNSFETLHIVPLSKELATYTGCVKSSMTNLADTTHVYWLMETGVLIKRDGAWKLLSGQTNLLNK